MRLNHVYESYVDSSFTLQPTNFNLHTSPISRRSPLLLFDKVFLDELLSMFLVQHFGGEEFVWLDKFWAVVPRSHSCEHIPNEHLRSDDTIIVGICSASKSQ